MKLYLDLDGVLTDFDLQYKKLFGHLKIKDEDTKWKLISVIPDLFFSKMPWTITGKKLFKQLRNYNPIILSSCGADDNWKIIAEAKKKWMKKNLGSIYRNAILVNGSAKKVKYSGEGMILIDDSKANIKLWERKKGIGILHKTYSKTMVEFNKVWESAKNT
jgi:hypothetical protein